MTTFATPESVLDELGLVDTDSRAARVTRATAAANTIIGRYVTLDDPDDVPADLELAAIALAAGLYRRPAAWSGTFAAGDELAVPVARDVLAQVWHLIAPYAAPGTTFGV